MRYPVHFICFILIYFQLHLISSVIKAGPTTMVLAKEQTQQLIQPLEQKLRKILGKQLFEVYGKTIMSSTASSLKIKIMREGFEAAQSYTRAIEPELLDNARNNLEFVRRFLSPKEILSSGSIVNLLLHSTDDLRASEEYLTQLLTAKGFKRSKIHKKIRQILNRPDGLQHLAMLSRSNAREPLETALTYIESLAGLRGAKIFISWNRFPTIFTVGIFDEMEIEENGPLRTSVNELSGRMFDLRSRIADYLRHMLTRDRKGTLTLEEIISDLRQNVPRIINGGACFDLSYRTPPTPIPIPIRISK